MNKIQIIDVFGQFYDKGTDHYYTYSSPQLKEQVGWKRYINDPRVFLNGIGRAYSTWCTDEGWWIAICIQPNPHDTRQGFAEIAFCLGACRPVNGKETVDLLNRAANFFVLSKPTLSGADAKNFDKDLFWKDEDTDKWLLNNPIELVPCKINKSTLSGMLSNPAYRTYSSETELQSALTFISQNGYEEYSQVFIIPKQAEQAVNAKSVDDIKIQRILLVKDSVDGKADKTQVNENGRLTITFSKKGYKSIQIGTRACNSQYGYIDGDVFRVNEASQASVVFNKHIYISCQEQDGRTIDDAHVYINGQRYDAASLRIEGVDIPETISQLSIEVGSHNYEREKGSIKDIQNGQTYPIPLKRKGYSVTFLVDGISFRANKTITSKSSEYYSLRDYGAEIAGNEITVRVPRPKRKPGPQPPLPPKPGGGKVISPKIIKRVLKIVGIIFLLWILYAGWSLLWEYERPWPFNHTEKVATPDTTTITTSAVAVEDSAALSHDISYMKKENTWDKAQLQSQKYKELYDYISNGQIDEILQSNWFDSGSPINGFWHDEKGNGIYDMLTSINGNSILKGDASKAMKDCSTNGTIKLSSLKKNLQDILAPKDVDTDDDGLLSVPAPNPKTKDVTPKEKKTKTDQGKKATKQVKKPTEESSKREMSHP